MARDIMVYGDLNEIEDEENRRCLRRLYDLIGIVGVKKILEKIDPAFMTPFPPKGKRALSAHVSLFASITDDRGGFILLEKEVT